MFLLCFRALRVLNRVEMCALQIFIIIIIIIKLYEFQPQI